jgi:hypothetical protein
MVYSYTNVEKSDDREKQGYVHDLCTPNRPNPCKTASTIVENWGIHHYIKPQNREND